MLLACVRAEEISQHESFDVNTIVPTERSAIVADYFVSHVTVGVFVPNAECASGTLPSLNFHSPEFPLE